MPIGPILPSPSLRSKPWRSFTPAERARLAPHFSNVDGPVFALVGSAGDGQGRDVRPLLALSRARCGGCSWTSSRTRCPSARRGGRRRRGRAGGGALRAHLRRLRGRLGGAARRRAHRVRVGARTSSPRCCSARGSRATWSSRRATSPTTRRCPAAATATTATRRSARSTRRRWTSLFDAYSQALPRVRAWVDSTYPGRARRVRGGAPARGQGQGAGPAARAAARRVAVAHGHLRERPGLRAADPAPARAPAARGARVRRADARGGQGRDPELRRARRAPRPRRRLGRLPERAPRRRAALGRAARAGPRRGAPRRARRSRLVHVDGDEDRLLAALLFEAAGVPEERTLAAVHALGRGRARADARRARRRAREPPPPPGPRLRGAALPLRDRLRLRRVPRPPAPPDAHRPVAAADARPRRRGPRGGRRRPAAATLYERALDRSRAEYERLRDAGLAEAAPYALCLGYRIRYVLDLNAREAMHLTELRSRPRGPRQLPRRRPGDAHRDRRASTPRSRRR